MNATIPLACGWCNSVLRQGIGLVSHGICCLCLAKHFPGKDHDGKHDWEYLSPGVHQCTVCEKEETIEP